MTVVQSAKYSMKDVQPPTQHNPAQTMGPLATAVFCRKTSGEKLLNTVFASLSTFTHVERKNAG